MNTFWAALLRAALAGAMEAAANKYLSGETNWKNVAVASATGALFTTAKLIHPAPEDTGPSTFTAPPAPPTP